MDISQRILSDITIFQKYAKFDKSKQRRENWQEICERNTDMHVRKYPQLETEIRQVYRDFVIPKKVLPSMRSMQFGGAPIELSNNRMFNCAYVAIDNPAAFWESMFLLLGGSGVGFSVQNRHVNRLPVVQGPTKKSRRFLIGDSIEGWADAVRMLVRSYFEGKSDPAFDFRDIRVKGAQLVTSGGKAPGPDPLRICLDHIRAVLNNAISRQLKSIECHDIMCHIADAVLSGGIRRAALISLFSHDDMDMMNAKYQHWYYRNPQRGRANNSVVLKRGEITEEQFFNIWKRVKDSGSGEPGFFWTNDYDMGTNPCCVTGDTLVKVSDGVSVYDVRMDELVDKYRANTGPKYVMSFDTNTNTMTFDTITAAEMTRANAEVIKLVLGNGAIIKLTPDHKVYTENRGYVEAKDLADDDVLIYSDLTKISVVSSVGLVNEDTYDITVENNHNFFANGLLVSNCEISLKSMQFCNLTEINASDMTTQEELNARAKAASFIGTLQAGYTDFHYLRPEWKENTDTDALIGVGITGIGSGGILPLDLDVAANIVNEENAKIAAIIGINSAARTTCIKPSGTTGLTVGSSSGIHAWHNDYYIRRMRVGKNEALYRYMIQNVPGLIEDCQFKPHLEAVMSFPQRAPVGSILRTESAMDLLERVKKFNTEWVHSGYRTGANHHNVSCTISVKDDEWATVGRWMWDNRESYTGISVLPYDNGTYVQAPFEDCAEVDYERMMKLLHEVDLDDVVEQDDHTSLNDQVACAGGACAI